MFTEEMAVEMLRKKFDELERLPKKEDFDGADVARIKSRLGPWNRALEAAGLKKKKPRQGKKRKTKEKNYE